jgi:hypothetical protein
MFTIQAISQGNKYFQIPRSKNFYLALKISRFNRGEHAYSLFLSLSSCLPTHTHTHTHTHTLTHTPHTLTHTHTHTLYHDSQYLLKPLYTDRMIKSCTYPLTERRHILLTVGCKWWHQAYKLFQKRKQHFIKDDATKFSPSYKIDLALEDEK